MARPDSLIDLFHYNVINSRPCLRFSPIAFHRGPSVRPSVRRFRPVRLCGRCIATRIRIVAGSRRNDDISFKSSH